MPLLPISPAETTKLLLKKLSSRRMRDVLERRFGLKGGRVHTLEAIGREYKITRERVRQIEADALRHLARHHESEECAPVFAALESHLREHGAVMAEEHLLATLADRRAHHPHLSLLLEVGNPFLHLPETEEFSTRWALERNTAQAVEGIGRAVVRELAQVGHPVPFEVLDAMMARHAREALGETPGPAVREAYLATCQQIQKNPYGEYGLSEWVTIRPRGIKDKAYLVLAKAEKAMHFREVAEAINRVAWSGRRAHPQTVHNELIKDPRFVLVGRGLYALREWGYEPGVVRDVLVSVLKRSSRPLAREEIVRQVLEKRFVKEPTILLNLQNRNYFRRTEDGRYTLV